MTLVALIQYKVKCENETSEQNSADTREALRNTQHGWLVFLF